MLRLELLAETLGYDLNVGVLVEEDDGSTRYVHEFKVVGTNAEGTNSPLCDPDDNIFADLEELVSPEDDDDEKGDEKVADGDGAGENGDDSEGGKADDDAEGGTTAGGGGGGGGGGGADVFPEWARELMQSVDELKAELETQDRLAVPASLAPPLAAEAEAEAEPPADRSPRRVAMPATMPTVDDMWSASSIPAPGAYSPVRHPEYARHRGPPGQPPAHHSSQAPARAHPAGRSPRGPPPAHVEPLII